MSAYVVDKAHVDALVTAGLVYGRRYPLRWGADHQHVLDHENAGEVGAMLWRENDRSVSYRYSEGPTGYGTDVPYEHKQRPVLSPVAVLKALDCYEYQTCEHPDWRQSQAYQFCDSLRRLVIGALDGYEAAAWEVTA